MPRDARVIPIEVGANHLANIAGMQADHGKLFDNVLCQSWRGYSGWRCDVLRRARIHQDIRTVTCLNQVTHEG